MEEFKNPYLTNLISGGIGILLGLLVVFVPGKVTDIGAYQFYCTYFGIALMVFALAWIVYYVRRNRQFRAFLASDEEKIRWDYTDEQYAPFKGELYDLQMKAIRKKLYTLLGSLVLMTVVLYFLLSEAHKGFVIIFFVFFALTSLITIFLGPLSHKRRADTRPYCSIIGVNEAYVMGNYHRWTKCHAKIKQHRTDTHNYHVLALNYECFTANGRLFREWNAMMPDYGQETQKEARAMASTINKATKNLAKQPKKDPIERAFDAMLGKNKNTDEIKKK